jgi:HEAT repeat protein
MSISPESVKKLLDSADYGDRIRGLNQLRDLPDEIAFVLIQPLVNDSNARVRYAAISQFDRLGQQNETVTWELLRDRLRNDPEIDVKSAAADAIGTLKLPEAFEELQQTYFQTQEWLLQLSIIATLGELGDPRGLDLLKAALSNENEMVLTAAIGAIGELGDPQTVEWITPFATHPDWQIRYRLAQALGHLNGTQAQAILQQLAQDPLEQVSQEARSHLGK